MPSFTFVGDEPLPLPCSFTISDKAKHAFSKANETKDSSNTQTIASLVTAIPRLVQFRLHYQKPGSLGVSIRCGAQFCIVIAKANPTSQFKVNDAIISCNGCRYENMTKLEGGIIAWMDFLKTSGEKCFIVRRGDKVAPLKDIGTSNTKICASGRACSGGSSNSELSLAQVSLHWKTGKVCHQTSQCKDAISSCLFNGMSAGDIARYVVRSLNKDDQAIERQRVRDCAYNLLKAAGRAAPATTATKLTEVEDLLPLGIPFQQNGVIYTKRRKLLSEAAANIHEKLGSNGTGRINLEATEDVGTQAEMDQDQAKHRSVDMVVSGTIDILERASDTAIITPSNSMEEVDTTESNR